MSNYTDKEYAEDFIKLLQKFKPSMELITINERRKRNVTKLEYNNYFIFRHMICELFYQALQSIPHIITEYTITCVNNKCKNEIVIGVFDDIDEDGETTIAKIITEDSIFTLTKDNVHSLYVANRTNYNDDEIIDCVMMMLYMNGDEPKITTSYKSTKRLTKW